jgi:16S rRNA (uracil1498-N3)-methyltransferase
VVTPHTARAHVFVDDLEAPRLSDADHRHLARVLRLGPDEDVTASDGRGRWRPCHLGDGPLLDVAGEVVADPEPTPRLTVAFALVKGDRPELVVQKLTELGIDRIVPFVAERSVVRWDDAKRRRQATRFATIAREAAMQCRRTWLPEIGDLSGFAEVAKIDGALMAERSGNTLPRSARSVLVGPEGGWSMAETNYGLPLVQLSDHVLRAETAAVTAGALLGAMRSQALG